MAPELASILDTVQPIVELAKGFGGDIGPAEGPLWWKEGGYLLFNDINAARRMKYTPRQGVAVAMEKTNEANGLTRDLQGRIISAEHLTRRVTRTDADGSITVVANSFQGKRLLRPRRGVLTVGLDLDARLVSRTTLPNGATGSSHLQMISASAP